MASESVATILCSCKQTRFDIINPNYREVSHKDAPYAPTGREFPNHDSSTSMG